MRHVAGIGMLLLALAGCQSLPALVRIEVDGSTLELKKKVTTAPEPPPAAPGDGGDAPAR